MIEPTEEDIGRSVIYRPPNRNDKDETGVITSFNYDYVFVRYGTDKTSRATVRRHLVWE